MEFIKTISTLLEKTKEIYVYAMAAYTKDGPAIGIRATYYDDMHNDPVVDKNVFMVCGEILNRHYESIKNMEELEDYLNYTDMTSLVIRLHADVLAAPAITTISLGDYFVTDFEIQRADQQTGQLERVKLNLARIQSSLIPR